MRIRPADSGNQLAIWRRRLLQHQHNIGFSTIEIFFPSTRVKGHLATARSVPTDEKDGLFCGIAAQTQLGNSGHERMDQRKVSLAPAKQADQRPSESHGHLSITGRSSESRASDDGDISHVFKLTITRLDSRQHTTASSPPTPPAPVWVVDRSLAPRSDRTAG